MEEFPHLARLYQAQKNIACRPIALDDCRASQFANSHFEIAVRIPVADGAMNVGQDEVRRAKFGLVDPASAVPNLLAPEPPL